MWFIKKEAKKVAREVGTIVGEVDRQLETAVHKTDAFIEPVRKSAFRRFPTVFLLLVTFGVAAVMFAFERILSNWAYLHNHPWLVLFIGVAVLAATGRLYKKLD